MLAGYLLFIFELTKQYCLHHHIIFFLTLSVMLAGPLVSQCFTLFPATVPSLKKTLLTSRLRSCSMVNALC